MANIFVSPCQNTTFNFNKCAPQADIDAFMADNANFYLRMSFTNPVINPNEPNHI